ncbi:MAG: hypothetical protein ACRDQA_07560 [Nocardioidaceae bacterium]
MSRRDWRERYDLIACSGGPLDGQWFTPEDWDRFRWSCKPHYEPTHHVVINPTCNTAGGTEYEYHDPGCSCAYGSEDVEFGNSFCTVHGTEGSTDVTA